MPDQFWRLTPFEFKLKMQAHNEVKVDIIERKQEMTAWAVAHLMNISGKQLKNDITVDELLGRKKKKTKTQEQGTELLERLKKKFSGGGD